MEYYKHYTRFTHNPELFKGLCRHFSGTIIFELIEPNPEELQRHMNDGGGMYFWGRNTQEEANHEFGTLRQTIILLCAAINDEL